MTQDEMFHLNSYILYNYDYSKKYTFSFWRVAGHDSTGLKCGAFKSIFKEVRVHLYIHKNINPFYTFDIDHYRMQR